MPHQNKKMGRPLSENPKRNRYVIHLDDATNDKFNFIAEQENITRAEVIRRGIEIQYNSLREKE